MTKHPNSSSKLIAFIAATDFESLGISGGALLVNTTGRPVEFHCTTPVLTNRTQEILYGRTLKTFLHCDQIGRALLGEFKNRPDVIVVRQTEFADLPSITDIPCVLACGEDAMGESPESLSASARRMDVDGQRLISLSDDWDTEQLLSLLSGFHRQLPIDEPFERISQALDEAHAVSR